MAGDEDLVAAKILTGVTIFGVTGNVKAASGSAGVGDVLYDKTFSNSSGTGLTGTMPNIGSKDFTPKATDQTIDKGYHDGTGKVAGDEDLTAGNIKDGVDIFGVLGTATTSDYPAPVPETGIDGCWDSSGGSVGCSDTGQDGESKPGVSLPEPRFTNNDNGSVTDNLTGLIWLKDANCFGSQSWANALSKANLLNGGGSSCGLSDGSVAGDWRLPTIRELHSLIHFGYSNPALSNTTGTGHWSGGESLHKCSVLQLLLVFNNCATSNHSYAFGVGLQYGFIDSGDKASSFNVWPVRGGAVDPLIF